MNLLIHEETPTFLKLRFTLTVLCVFKLIFLLEFFDTLVEFGFKLVELNSNQSWIQFYHFPVEKLFLLLFYHLSIGLFKFLLFLGYPQLKFHSQTLTILSRKLIFFFFNLLQNYLIELILKVVDILIFDRQQFFQIINFTPQNIHNFIFH